MSVAALCLELGEVPEQIAALRYAASCFAGCGASYLEAAALAAVSRAEVKGNPREAARAWEQVERLYAMMDLPQEDRIHGPPDQ